MLDMNFASFLTLLIISLIASLILHFAVRYRHLGRIDGFFWKWIVGWFGAWIASPVLGHWGWRFPDTNAYVIPAFIGAFAFAFVAAAAWRAWTMRELDVSSKEPLA